MLEPLWQSNISFLIQHRFLQQKSISKSSQWKIKHKLTSELNHEQSKGLQARGFILVTNLLADVLVKKSVALLSMHYPKDSRWVPLSLFNLVFTLITLIMTSEYRSPQTVNMHSLFFYKNFVLHPRLNVLIFLRILG